MGRPKGSLNKKTVRVEEIAAKFKLDPFEVLMMIVNADWQGLGYESKTKVVALSAGGEEIHDDVVKLSDRVQAAKEASKYLYSQKQAVALSGDQTGITINVVDYTKKELE